jgi:hypothetical protein
MYNIAVKYLIEKYKDQCSVRHTKSFQQKLNKAKKHEKIFMAANRTESDIYYELPRILICDDFDKELFLLVQQYNLGQRPKQELEAKLIELNLVESK